MLKVDFFYNFGNIFIQNYIINIKYLLIFKLFWIILMSSTETDDQIIQ